MYVLCGNLKINWTVCWSSSQFFTFDFRVKFDPVMFQWDAPVHDGRVATSEQSDRKDVSRDRREPKRFGGFRDSPATSTVSPAERNAHFTDRLLKRKVRLCVTYKEGWSWVNLFWRSSTVKPKLHWLLFHRPERCFVKKNIAFVLVLWVKKWERYASYSDINCKCSLTVYQESLSRTSVPSEKIFKSSCRLHSRRNHFFHRCGQVNVYFRASVGDDIV